MAGKEGWGIHLTKPSVRSFELGLGEAKRREYLDRKGRLSRERALESAEAWRELARCGMVRHLACLS